MTLTVHHLGISQSERIVILCEELGIPYKLVHHTRDPLTAPSSLTSVPGNSTGKAPFITDDSVSPPVALTESAAICEYIAETYGNGKFIIKPGEKGYVDYIYWFNYCSGSLQPTFSTAMMIGAAGLPEDSFVKKFSEGAVQKTLTYVNNRLKDNKWFAGEEFTAADIMCSYSLGTGRYWSGMDLKGYEHIVRWLRDLYARPAVKRAMEKGDPEMRLLDGEEGIGGSLLAFGGVKSEVWKKQR